MGFLPAKKKLNILAKAVELQTNFRSMGSDTGAWRGSDTGASAGSGRVHSAKLAAILNANTNYASEGWYQATKTILVSFGETVT
jgi:hypothetical protein